VYCYRGQHNTKTQHTLCPKQDYNPLLLFESDLGQKTKLLFWKFLIAYKLLVFSKLTIWWTVERKYHLISNSLHILKRKFILCPQNDRTWFIRRRLSMGLVANHLIGFSSYLKQNFLCRRKWHINMNLTFCKLTAFIWSTKCRRRFGSNFLHLWILSFIITFKNRYDV
jgi:hypothetical protein